MRPWPIIGKAIENPMDTKQYAQIWPQQKVSLKNNCIFHWKYLDHQQGASEILHEPLFQKHQYVGHLQLMSTPLKILDLVRTIEHIPCINLKAWYQNRRMWFLFFLFKVCMRRRGEWLRSHCLEVQSNTQLNTTKEWSIKKSSTC